ncbi:MAG: YcaO-like family protein [Rhizobiales bacterium]|nr:YcaO-like family protein [Hyphomicrobiales bacterium]
MLQPVLLDDVARELAGADLDPAITGRLLGIAARLDRIFRIRPPGAPGACFFGAEGGPSGPLWHARPRRRIGLSGMGLSPAEALIKCLGEAAELLSQFETGSEAAECRTEAVVATGDVLKGDRTGLTMVGRRLHDDAPCRIPLGLCIRPAEPCAYGEPAFPLGLGGGAGPTAEAAILHGLLELIERDAMALWWRGGGPARPIGAGDQAMPAVTRLLDAARRNAPARQVTLIDITGEFGVPVVAALSTGPDGRGFACGLAARPTPDRAVHAALLEMLQMELAQDLAEAKRGQGGEGCLNPLDRAHLAKRAGPPAMALGPVRRAMAAASPDEARPMADRPVAVTVRTLAARLAACGIDAFAVDLTRKDLDIAAFRVVAPGLQPEPSGLVTPRLRACCEAAGVPPGPSLL